MEPLSPRDTRPLFRPLLGELLALLRGLGPDEWDRPTVAGAWRVRDVAAHLLDGDLRRIAVHRDDHVLPSDGPIASERDLARFVNGLNASGVAWARRLSPALLADLLEATGAWSAAMFEQAPLDGLARYAVSWAGEAASERWLDTAREYTERWHHQMQIRDAVGVARLLEPAWMDPLLDTVVRALPHAYASFASADGTAVTLEVRGETSGDWTVLRAAGRWEVRRGRPAMPDATARVRTDDAWRLFFNALPPDELSRRVQVEGREELAWPLLRARAVVL